MKLLGKSVVEPWNFRAMLSSSVCSGLTDLSQWGEHSLPSDFRLRSSTKFLNKCANAPKVLSLLYWGFLASFLVHLPSREINNGARTTNFWNPGQTGSLTNCSSPGLVAEIREEYWRTLSYSAIVSSVGKIVINISGQTCFASFPT